MQHHNSPEGRAARTATPEVAPTIAVSAEIDRPVLDLLNAMLDASEVHILGNLPWECSKKLIELQQGRVAEGRQRRPKTVHYYIADRDDKDAGATMGPQIQQWITGRFGVRNWVVPHRKGNIDTLVMHKTTYDAGACVVVTSLDDYHRAAVINSLPVAGYPTKGVLTVAEYDNEQRDIVRAHIHNDLLPNSRPYEVRQVRCVGPSPTAGRENNTFSREVLRLTTQRELRPHEAEPAAVVAVCGISSHGPVIMLKRRSRANSIDDFDTLSLISEHVIVEDLTNWLQHLTEPLQADERIAKEQLWTAAGRPRKLILEEHFFAEAAQRELFISCGLNVPSERLKLCGWRLVNRTDDTHLGFAVYRLDLIQRDDLDELRIVQNWSSDMEQIPIAELYSETNRRQLNRLLRVERNWLQRSVFSSRRGQVPEQR